jgi:hypothetical protein
VQFFGARRGIRAHHRNRWTDAVIIEVMFGEPDGVVAAAIHNLDSFQRALVYEGQRYAPIRPTEKLKNAKFHNRLCLKYRNWGSVAKRLLRQHSIKLAKKGFGVWAKFGGCSLYNIISCALQYNC